MGKKRRNYNSSKVNEIFNDLEAYKDFCCSYGYRFDESALYDMRTYPFQQFNKKRQGKNFKDQWGVDIQRFGPR